jgi:hypothetical protein
MTTYDITANLPAGYVITRATLDALQEAFEANGRQPLSDAQVEGVIGQPLPTPTIKRSFPTGEHPAAHRNPFSRSQR